MRFAISVPNFAPYQEIPRLVDYASAAESAGWDGFFLWDHINTAGYMDPAPLVDPWIALGSIATATSRIRIGTMVTPLARRRPWVVARQAVTIDHLSGGRFTLGAGLGFPPHEEFAALGEDPDDRVRASKLDEALDVITGLWSGEPFSYTGEHFRLKDVTFLPKPLQQPRIPIWVAGMWPNRAPFRRAARYEGSFPMDAETFLLEPGQVADVRAYIAERGGAAPGYEIAIGDWSVGRDPAEVRDRIAAQEAAGATCWVESPRSLDELEQLVRRVPG